MPKEKARKMTSDERAEIALAVSEISEQMHEALTRLCVLEDRLKEVPGRAPRAAAGAKPAHVLRLIQEDGRNGA